MKKCECEHESHGGPCQGQAVESRNTPYGTYQLCSDCYQLHMNLTYIKELGQGDWSIDDGLDGFQSYSRIGGYDGSELGFDVLNWKGTGKLTVLSYWNGRNPQKSYWREQAIHEATGVQIGYLFYEE